MNQSTMSILLIVGLIVIFYFMLIRPQQKRMRQQMELMGSLRVGDDVMTSSGIYGTVSEVEEDTVLLEVAEEVHIRVAKNAIVRVFSEQGEPEEEPPEAVEEAEPEEEPESEEPEAVEKDEVVKETKGSGNTSKGKKK